MEASLQKAKVLVMENKITPGPGCYFVRSQTGTNKMYRVTLDGLFPACSCDDFELTGEPCKHMLAARMFRAQQEAGRPAPVDEPGPAVKRPTYPQNWPAYNASQINEGYYVRRLLHDLCRTIPQPPARTGRGRPALPVRDGIYAACLKVYEGLSARRAMSDMEAARDDGFLSAVPCFNSILNVLDDPATSPILDRLIRVASQPLAAVEVDFAADSTGFSSTSYSQKWFDFKYGQEKTKAKFVKLHAMCGVKTNIITAVTILDQNAADSPQLPGLVKTTAKEFEVHEVSTDKAYTGTENFQAVDDVGGVLYSAFKSNATGAVGGIFEKAFHYFSMYRAEFLAHYHKRSNVESTFSAVKRKLGDSVRGKTDVSMKNEVLAKLVCYNLTVCIAEWYTLGVQPIFLGAEPESENRDILRMPRRG